MRKLKVFLLFVFVLQIGLTIKYAGAEEGTEAIEIKSVVKAFLNCYVNKDLDCLMSHVSINYSNSGGKVEDYNTFKSVMGRSIMLVAKKYCNFSIDPELNILEIKDNKAAVELEYSWKGFDLDRVEEQSGKVTKLVILTKEDNLWKIITYGVASTKPK